MRNIHKTIDLKYGNLLIAGTGKDGERADYASKELSYWLRKITGRQFKIHEHCHKPGKGDFILRIGEEPGKYSCSTRLAEDEIEIKCLNDSEAVLRGGGPSGNLFAVYELLDLLGCRWYAPDESQIPSLKTLTIPENYRSCPGFEYRDALWFATKGNGSWSARNRFNGNFSVSEGKEAGRWGWAEPFVHTFYKIIPPSKYAAIHPEYFSYRIGQGHVSSSAQLCLSNADVFEITLEHVLRNMADKNIRIVSVSQNDCSNPCQCDECALKDRKAGSHSGSLIDFVNRLAEKTCHIYPDKYVSTIAYTYTEKPPVGMEVHKNEIIIACHMEPSCDTHPLKNCKHNERYVKALEGWLNISRRVYVWHYVTNFLHNLLFHPNLDALSEDIKYYRNAGVKGMMFQGQQVKGVSLDNLHAYLQGRMMWNPDRDYWREAEEFCNMYYGPAGEEVFSFIEILHETARKGVHAHLYTHPSEGIFSGAQLKKAGTLLEKAIRKNDPGSRFSKRLSMMKLWLDYTQFVSIPPIEKKGNAFQVKVATNASALFDECRKGIKKTGIDKICEFPSGDQDLARKYSWCANPAKFPVYSLENEILKIEVVPRLSGMVCSFIDRKSETNIFCHPKPWIIRYPYLGGYVEGRNSSWSSPDLQMEYRLIDISGNRMIIAADLGEGIVVERTFTVCPDEPVLLIRNSYSNNSKKNKVIQPHRFVICSVGNLQDIEIYRDMSNSKSIITGSFDKEELFVSVSTMASLSGKSLPLKNWGFINRKTGLGLIENLHGQKTVNCAVYGHTRDQRMHMITMLEPMITYPGSKKLFEHSYKLISKNLTD